MKILGLHFSARPDMSAQVDSILKAIYGYEPSYRELMIRADLTTLRARREDRELRFTQKCGASDRFAKWFTTKAPGRTRGSLTYVEQFARCCRCYNSLLYNMRRESGIARLEKILSLHFSARPDMSTQVDSICQKFRSRVWYLRHLHHNGFREEELLRVYKSTILPCHDYFSSVFHSRLTLSKLNRLERL